VLAIAGAPAFGFVRKKTDGGVAEYWKNSCIPISIYTFGFTDMSRDQVASAIGAAAHTWSPTAVTCADGVSHPFTELVMSMADDGAKPPYPAWDGNNTVIFYSATFPPPPYPATTLQKDSLIIALTSVFARADGHIVDADVQINNMDYQWTIRDPNNANDQADNRYDLQNAVTHELGHLQGLGHSCWYQFSDFEQPIDDTDAGVPVCDGPDSAAAAMTVMYALIETPAEISKRTLSADDIRAVCEIYPSTSDPNSCSTQTPNDACGCNTGWMGPAGVAVGLLVIGLYFAGRRRRRS